MNFTNDRVIYLLLCHYKKNLCEKHGNWSIPLWVGERCGCFIGLIYSVCLYNGYAIWFDVWLYQLPSAFIAMIRWSECSLMELIWGTVCIQPPDMNRDWRKSLMWSIKRTGTKEQVLEYLGKNSKSHIKKMARTNKEVRGVLVRKLPPVRSPESKMNYV